MESELLVSRIEDTAAAAQNTCVPKFLGFLTPQETAAAQATLKNKVKFCFGGGYTGAERVLLCVLPDWCEENDVDYPIRALTVAYKNFKTLSHRDFLGAIMALGIKRESVGDILTQPSRAVIFVKKEISDFIKQQLLKVGSTGVTVTDGFTPPLPGIGVKLENTVTVSSLRLDCVVSALTGLSRNSAVQCIEQGFVSVNSVCREKITYKINEGDKITVRGIGKFDILSAGGISKKGRIILKSAKYV